MKLTVFNGHAAEMTWFISAKLHQYYIRLHDPTLCKHLHGFKRPPNFPPCWRPPYFPCPCARLEAAHPSGLKHLSVTVDLYSSPGYYFLPCGSSQYASQNPCPLAPTCPAHGIVGRSLRPLLPHECTLPHSTEHH